MHTSNLNSGPAAAAIRGRKLAELVAQRIISDIVDQKLEEGTRLPPEDVMLERYEIGRASLREGLRLLEINGIVAMRSGSGGGPIVADYRMSGRNFGRMAALHFHAAEANYGELQAARLEIDTVLAGLAAQNATEEQLDAMGSILEQERLLVERGASSGELSVVAQTFHLRIAEAANSRILRLFEESLTTLLHRRLSRDRYTTPDWVESHTEHRSVMEAIVARDAARASAGMRHHIARGDGEVNQALNHLIREIVEWE